jgi:hypothetical protein
LCPADKQKQRVSLQPLQPFSLGFDHLKLTVRNQGLDARLTGVAGSVIDEWIA